MTGARRSRNNQSLLLLCGIALALAWPRAARADSRERGLAEPAELEAFLDAYCAEAMPEHHVPGAVVTVVRGGELFLAKGYGVRDRASEAWVDPERTLFRVASISKLFLATAVMQLVERGLLDLDADVNTYLREVRVPATYPEPVTLTHLLTHTPGFDDLYIGISARRAEDVLPLRSYLIRRLPPRVMPPGRTMSYSNHGSALAGLIVENVSGMDYAEYVDAHILQPLGMHRSGLHLDQGMAPHLATGYYYWKDAYHVAPYEYEHAYPAGAMHTTGTDMARFMIAHLQNGRYGDVRLFSEATAQIMHARRFTHHPELPGMATGFFEHGENGLRGLAHGGLLRGFTSYVLLLPEPGVGVFVSATNGGVHAETTKFQEDLIEQFLDRYFLNDPAPLFPPSSAFAETTGRFAGAYIPNRRSRRTVQKLAFLLDQYRMTVERDGTLVWRHGDAEPRAWAHRAGLRFDEVDGEGRATFREDAHGRIVHFIDGQTVYDRIAWWETARAQVVLLTFVVALFTSAAVVWVGGGVLRRVWHVPPRVGHLPRAVAGLAGTLALISLTMIALVLGGDSYEIAFGIPRHLKIGLAFLQMSALLTIPMVLFCAAGWIAGRWPLVARVHYTLVTVAALAFVGFLAYWNLLGFRY